jgi:hypothetical protein
LPLASPEDFWPVVLGTSNRAALEALPEPARLRVRVHVTEALRARRQASTAMDVLYARLRK